MEDRTKIIVELSALASRPEHRERLRDALAAARAAAQVKREEIYECFLQLHLFAGFPAALEAMRALRAAWPRGHDEKLEVREPVSYPQFVERGQKLFEQVYGANSERVRAEIRDLSVELGAWTMNDGYSKTLSRPGLASIARELATVAGLTQLGWERQLFSHILGARNVGASKEDVEEAISIGALGDEEKLKRALVLAKK
ncbi:MAG: carboxymuconolactone decarboxylase family protein [Bacteroidota bacterium]|nr:carboxymuconolactone decarboxylase family protein [Bacteroidota bacterium]MDP4233639.1 carboxymuconolactone decarboxylase family protein [Bacteroidota bacterium]MDP4243101.1 carboxymuconolactone decarboxylase family protein [Bacteroidota bacterium]MDP4288453.1 carboxymuconolactone decarboxylase family protein [Bacteroidota bacterium]